MVNDGWTITDDPLYVPFGKATAEIDLGAEKMIAAERGSEKIAIEVKSFVDSQSDVTSFHVAVGQFLNYRIAMRDTYPERELFLAVPAHAYEDFFHQPIIQKIVAHYQLAIIVFDVEQQTITQWIKPKPTGGPSAA